MTLLAAFRSFGFPTLVGDLVLTSTAGRGLRKKLVLVRPNLAVGWTGHLIAAHDVVAHLQAWFESRPSTLASLTEALTGLSSPALGKLQVTLVGWFTEGNEAHCFRWNSDYPRELFFGDPMTDGSGGDFADLLIGPRGLVDDPGNGSSRPRPIGARGELELAAQLMAREIGDDNAEDKSFGFAYEILTSEVDGRFGYVDDVLYYAVTYSLDADGKYLCSRFRGPFSKVRTLEGAVTVDRYDPATRTRDLHFIDPVGKALPASVFTSFEQSVRSHSTFPFRSAYYCAFCTYESPGFISRPVSRVITASEALPRVGVTPENRFVEHVSREEVEFLHRTIRDDMSKNLA